MSAIVQELMQHQGNNLHVRTGEPFTQRPVSSSTPGHSLRLINPDLLDPQVTAGLSTLPDLVRKSFEGAELQIGDYLSRLLS